MRAELRDDAEPSAEHLCECTRVVRLFRPAVMMKTFAREPIGAGPYRPVSFQPGQQLIVEANPRYAGKRMTFNRLVFALLDEDAGRLCRRARSGQLGLRALPFYGGGPAAGIILNSGYAIALKNRGIVFPMVPAGKKDANGYPVGNDVTADVAIRRAPTMPLIVSNWRNR